MKIFSVQLHKEQEAKGPLGNFLGAKLTILGDIPSVNTFLKKSIK